MRNLPPATRTEPVKTDGRIASICHGGGEHGLKSGHRTDDGVTDDGSHQAGHQRFHFEIFLVKNFRGDDRARQRRFENRGDAGAQSGGQRNVAFARGQFEQVGNAGAGGGADLGDGTFAARSQSPADRDGGRDQFENRDVEFNFFILVKCADGGVGADAGGGRSKFPGE